MITTVPNIGSNSGTGSSNETKSCTDSGLTYKTHYTWTVKAYNGNKWTNKTYTFTTQVSSESTPFSDKTDYKTEFNSQSNDNSTVTLNGWKETYINGWDGTKTAYFNESSTGSNKVVVTMKTSSGSEISNAKGIYFEFKVPYNYTNSGAGSVYLTIANSVSNIFLGFYPSSGDTYVQYTDGSSTYLNIEIPQKYLNRNYHRMFVHFNNATGVATFGIDDKIYSVQKPPRNFVSSSVYITLLTTGHPGIMADNIKIFNDQVFPIDDYMLEYYPDFKIAYPENNYDFTYSPVIHADQMTYNMTKPIFQFFNSYDISVSQTYFYNHSAKQAYDSECLADDANLRNYAISNQNINGIYTHSLKMNTNLKTSQVAAILAGWKNLMGSYPLLWVDHNGMQQNMDRNGSNPSSPYYIGGLRNDSSLKYAWVYYDDASCRLPIPVGYNIAERNSLNAFQLGGNGLVYSNSGSNNLFSSGMRILYPESSTVKYNYYVWELANEKGLALEHTYQQYYLYKNIDGTKYSKMSYPGYSAWKSAWNLHYRDTASPWTIMPEYITLMNKVLNNFTVNSGLGHLLIDRGVVYNGSSVFKSDNTIYVNTPSEMKNVTIYSRTNQTGKALERDGNYYPFTKGFYSWGATIPSNTGNKSYQLVNWNKYIEDNGQIGRMEFQSNKNITIYFKKSGSLTFELSEQTDPSNVLNKSSGTNISFSITGRNITFVGMRGCEYIVNYHIP
ncbi:Uncharacterised protein [uncultured archaeon]|nr:Uncharacterised protein [uncultured archaeon]